MSTNLVLEQLGVWEATTSRLSGLAQGRQQLLEHARVAEHQQRTQSAKKKRAVPLHLRRTRSSSG